MGAVGVAGSAHHELHGHAGDRSGVESVGRLAVGPLGALQQQVTPHSLQIGDRRPEILLRGDGRETGPAGCLQVDRHAARQLSQPLDLRGLTAGHELDMDVPAEPVALAEQLERGDEIVHHLDRAPRNAGGDEQPLAPPARPRAEEDADQLLRLEQSARHLPVPPHGAVVAVIAAGVGHEDAEQRHPHSRHRAEVPDVDGVERAGAPRVAEPRRQAFAIVGGERHQHVELALEIRAPRHWLLLAPSTVPE